VAHFEVRKQLLRLGQVSANCFAVGDNFSLLVNPRPRVVQQSFGFAYQFRD
jgi:hypothetical protein